MSKPNKARFKLATIRQQYVEAAGGEEVEAELSDGTTVTFPHPVFIDEDIAASIDAQDVMSGKVRALLGDEQFALLEKAGDDPRDVFLLFQGIQGEYQEKSRQVRPIRS